MSSSSLLSLFTAGLACLVPFTTAYTTPVGAEPVGNPISLPGLNSVVPAGQAYTVTWQPTTAGTVTLVLLKGPSTNAIPQYAIVEKIPNSGSYSWTPSTDLAPGQTGYGIELIDDATGQYQYTTQFGISNPAYTTWSSSSSSSPSTTSAVSLSASTPLSSTTSLTLSTWSTASSNATMSITTSSVSAGPITGTGYPVASTGGVPCNSSLVHPTGSLTVPASLATYASGSGLGGGVGATGSAIAPVQTGAAVAMATSFAGLVVAAGVAVFAF
ncbi:hypothetical protein LTR08_007045 [Meristemomyces frigidus]|nr:hypothetical protein LTR08_007045 [Meristemomyces frigidus]